MAPSLNDLQATALRAEYASTASLQDLITRYESDRSLKGTQSWWTYYGKPAGQAYNDAAYAYWGGYPFGQASLAAWWAADRISGLTDASAVVTWTDATTNAYAATQGTGAKQPTYKTNILNGRPVVRFLGSSSQILRVAGTVSTASSGTLIVVASVTSSVATQSFVTSADEASTTRLVDCNIQSGLMQITQNNAVGSDQISSGALTAATPYILVWASSGSAYTMRINGVNQALTVVGGANTGDWFGSASARDNFCFGSLKRTSESDFLTGDIAEVILYDAPLSVANTSLVEHYLANKYGISVS